MTPFLIVGLGNPGRKYIDTRHNAGRMAVAYLAEMLECPAWRTNKQLEALESEGMMEGAPVRLLLPETFMNNSGKSVRGAIRNTPLTPERVIVVYDDLDIPLGSLKVSFDRSSGGHRGIESIDRELGSSAYLRVRLGIAPHGGTAGAPSKADRFVLQPFSAAEGEIFAGVLEDACAAVRDIVTRGRDEAMNKWN